MWKRRVIWLVLLLVALTFYLFENNGRTLAALLTCVLVPPVSFLYSFLRCRRAVLRISVPERMSCGASAECRLQSSSEGSTVLHIENVHTGEAEQYRLFLKKGDNIVTLHNECCGMLSLNIRGMEAQDLFGLFSYKISREVKAEIVVVPNVFPVDIVMTESAHAMPDSDRYSSVKPGNDPSETFGMREYVPGDSIKAIHWKLSQKTGKTIVREMGLPIVSQVLLRYEGWKEPRLTPDEIHGMTSVFVSIAESLRDKGVDFCMEWGVSHFDIRSEELLQFAVEELLRYPVWKQKTELTRGGGFSHVVTLSPNHDPALTDLYNGSRITLISPGKEAGGLQPDGIWRRFFLPETMMEQMMFVEI